MLSRLPPPPHRGSPSPRDSLESLPKLGVSESIFTPSKGGRKEAREAGGRRSVYASNAGIHSGTYLVHFQVPHLRSIEFGVLSSLSLSSVHLQLWLHLHLGNRTSTLQGCSGCTVRRWASVWSKPRPSALLLPARGGGEKVAAAPPTPSVWSSGLQQPSGAVRLQRPGVPELPQGRTKFAASSPARPSSLSAAVARPGAFAATPSADSTPTDGGRAERTLKSCGGGTCACISPVGGPLEELV